MLHGDEQAAGPLLDALMTAPMLKVFTGKAEVCMRVSVGLMLLASSETVHGGAILACVEGIVAKTASVTNATAIENAIDLRRSVFKPISSSGFFRRTSGYRSTRHNSRLRSRDIDYSQEAGGCRRYPVCRGVRQAMSRFLSLK